MAWEAWLLGRIWAICWQVNSICLVKYPVGCCTSPIFVTAHCRRAGYHSYTDGLGWCSEVKSFQSECYTELEERKRGGERSSGLEGPLCEETGCLL